MLKHSLIAPIFLVLSCLLGLMNVAAASIIERHLELTTTRGDTLVGDFAAVLDGNFHVGADDLTEWSFTFRSANSDQDGELTLDQTNSIVHLFGYNTQANTLTPASFPLLLITGHNGSLQAIFGQFLAVYSSASGFRFTQVANGPIITSIPTGPSEGGNVVPPQDPNPDQGSGGDPLQSPVVPEPASFIIWSTTLLSLGGLATIRQRGRTRNTHGGNRSFM